METIPRTHEGKSHIFNFERCNIRVILDIEAQIREIQSKKKELPPDTDDKGVGLGESGYFDSEIYDGGGGKNKYEGYVTSIAANDEVDDEDEDVGFSQKRAGLGAPVALLNDVAQVCIRSTSYIVRVYMMFVLSFRVTRIMILLLIVEEQLLLIVKMSIDKSGVG